MHRSLADVLAILDAAQLTPGARAIAGRIFDVLAAAEARAHGATPETVHFHEVGAVDSIVDICSAAVCLDDLGIHDVIVPELSEGTGTIRCAHGIMPVPVPAVVNIASAAGIALRTTPVRGELVTPTGAAIVAATRTSDQLPERYAIRAVGLGAGKRNYEGCAGVLRAMLIEPLCDGAPSSQHGSVRETTGNPFAAAPVVKLETDLDDVTGEALGFVVEQLMAAGARDAHVVPTIMKKGRPGCQLQVICDEADVARLEGLIFAHTTTIGIRRMRMERDRLPREAVEAVTTYGPIAGKRVALPDGATRTYPEHDSVVAACKRTGAGYQDVVRAFLAVCGAPAE
ncbi:MAG: LarC family nickel insertion protein [Coriobacteriia bacterium]|nr:LarC family nickel insertion protein [Coriobacteriia bacterium]MBS5477922.1 LarC family nickel insertion protein [Coriobacteriia bacterium]